MNKKLIPLIILLLLVGGGILVLNSPPELNRKGGTKTAKTLVETMKVTRQDYQINVNSYGTAQPRTQSILVSQVSGQIMSIDYKFRPGGFFKKGDTLVGIDARDYEANVNIAEASLMDAMQAHAQEAARSDQALSDWQRLGDADEIPSSLVLREPQLQAAKARVLSAKSTLTKAELNQERTSIKAPFDGRVLRQLVDLGQVVSIGSQLAEIYATDIVEVRLPLRNADLSFVNLPEEDGGLKPKVTFFSELGGEKSWLGEIVRTEGAIDETSRQLHVVGQIKDPFGVKENKGQRLKIGEYVTAELSGVALKGVLLIPSEVIYQNTYVYAVENGVLLRKEIDIIWQNDLEAIVSAGIEVGDELVTTPLGQVTSGTRVRVIGDKLKQGDNKQSNGDI